MFVGWMNYEIFIVNVTAHVFSLIEIFRVNYSSVSSNTLVTVEAKSGSEDPVLVDYCAGAEIA
jgi:hypothetical protein